MHDERIKEGPVLGFENTQDGIFAQGIARQAINSLCGYAYDTSGAENLICLLYICSYFCFVAHLYSLTR
jgi:hypothetical protein